MTVSAPAEHEPAFRTKLESILMYASFAVIIVAGMGLLFAFRSFVVDDTYISFRYAAHLADGYGLVWNIGEAPSEGYTNFSWVVLLAAFRSLGLSIEALSRILGVGCLVASAVLVLKTGQLIHGAYSAATVLTILGLMIANPALASHALSGMETTAYLLLLVLTVYFAIRIVNSTRPRLGIRLRDLIGLSAAILLAGLTRPEGVMFGLLAVLTLTVLRPEIWKSRMWIGMITVTFLLGGAYSLWRWNYFGYLLPNSFYHKSSAGIISRDGAIYVMTFVVANVPLILLGFVRAVICKPKDAEWLLVIPGMLAVYYVTVEPEMGFNFRFLAPYYFLLVLFVVPLLERGLRWLRESTFLSPALVVTIAVFLLIGAQAKSILSVSSLVHTYVESDSAGGNRATLGKRLSHLPPDAAIATGEVGTLSWFSGLPTVDIAGLTDNYLNHHPTTVDYLLRRNAEVLVLASQGKSLDIYHASESNTSRYSQLYSQRKQIDQSYNLVGCWDRGDSYYLIFVRRDSPRSAQLVEILHEQGIPVCAPSSSENAGGRPQGSPLRCAATTVTAGPAGATTTVARTWYGDDGEPTAGNPRP